MDYYGVIGNPIAHSKSPFIHQRFAQLTQQELIYERIECPIGEFKAKIEHLQASYQYGSATSSNQNGYELKGCNVTIPFKQDAFDLATRHSARALLSGTYSVQEDGYIVNVRLIDIDSQRVLAAATDYIPDNVMWSAEKMRGSCACQNVA